MGRQQPLDQNRFLPGCLLSKFESIKIRVLEPVNWGNLSPILGMAGSLTRDRSEPKKRLAPTFLCSPLIGVPLSLVIDEVSQIFTASIKQDVGDPLLDFRAVPVHWVSSLFAGEPGLVANDSLNTREFGVDDFCCAHGLPLFVLGPSRVRPGIMLLFKQSAIQTSPLGAMAMPCGWPSLPRGKSSCSRRRATSEITACLDRLA